MNTKIISIEGIYREYDREVTKSEKIFRYYFQSNPLPRVQRYIHHRELIGMSNLRLLDR